MIFVVVSFYSYLGRMVELIWTHLDKVDSKVNHIFRHIDTLPTKPYLLSQVWGECCRDFDLYFSKCLCAEPVQRMQSLFPSVPSPTNIHKVVHLKNPPLLWFSELTSQRPSSPEARTRANVDSWQAPEEGLEKKQQPGYSQQLRHRWSLFVGNITLKRCIPTNFPVLIHIHWKGLRLMHSLRRSLLQGAIPPTIQVSCLLPEGKWLKEII